MVQNMITCKFHYGGLIERNYEKSNLNFQKICFRECKLLHAAFTQFRGTMCTIIIHSLYD